MRGFQDPDQGFQELSFERSIKEWVGGDAGFFDPECPIEAKFPVFEISKKSNSGSNLLLSPELRKSMSSGQGPNQSFQELGFEPSVVGGVGGFPVVFLDPEIPDNAEFPISRESVAKSNFGADIHVVPEIAKIPGFGSLAGSMVSGGWFLELAVKEKVKGFPGSN